MPFNCKTCGKSMTSSPSRERKYCSARCAYASKDRVKHIKPKDRGSAVCNGCGIEFILRTNGGQKFCSRLCASRQIGRNTIWVNRVQPRLTEMDLKCPVCSKQFKAWKANRRTYCSVKCSNSDPKLKAKRVKSFMERGHNISRYSRCPKGWVAIGGKRIFCKSSWEAKYARYLEWIKSIGKITDWQYEPSVFWFRKTKSGVRSYLPDFKVILLNGDHEWHEVKGWMDQKSRSKIDRMNRYYPSERLLVIGADWFKNANSSVGGIVPKWRTPFL